jgi:tRNA modification GTPase
LAGRQAAITSPVAGTTRDVIELRYDLSGLPVVFLDTAGLRTTEDAVESQGVARAVARAEAADLRILLTAPDAPLPASAEAVARRGDLRVRSKADLSTGAADNLLAISAVTGAGLPAMLDGVRTALASLATDVGLVGHLRQQQALQDGVSQLQVALKGLDSKASEEVSEDLRSALRAVERLTGHVGVEDVLGEVFSAFCLGK